jgi:hypothetical protein
VLLEAFSILGVFQPEVTLGRFRGKWMIGHYELSGLGDRCVQKRSEVE